MSLKTELAVQMQCSLIPVDDFKMQYSHSQFSGSFFKENHGLLAPAATAIFLAQVKFIYEGISSEPFEAVAKAYHGVADWGVSIENEPCTPELRISE